MKYRITLSLIIVLLGIGLYFNNNFLTDNFYKGGESFYKGYGHILDENFKKGLLFIMTYNGLFSLILGFFIIGLMIYLKKDWIKSLLIVSTGLIIIVLIIYGFIQLSNYKIDGYINKNRIIEINLTWLIRIVGFYMSYYICLIIKKEVKHAT